MDVPTLESSYWIGAAALLGFALLFNVLFTVALAYLEAPGKPQAIISKEDAAASQRHSVEMQQIKPTVNANGTSNKGMVLPFTPLDMSFSNTNYFVDIPGELKEEGVKENRLQLLQDVTTTFTPGVLTALMGVSGAGNTTLMDVDASFSMVSSRLRNPQVTNGSSLKELRGRIYSLAKDQNGCILLQAKFENPTNEEI